MGPSVPAIAAVRRELELHTLGERQTISCPCCGHDTGVEPYRRGCKPTDEQRALRQTMRAAGVSMKLIRRWLNLPSEKLSDGLAAPPAWQNPT